MMEIPCLERPSLYWDEALVFGCFHVNVRSSIRDINSSPLSAAYMRQWTGSSLVQVMACRLFDAKPLPEPMLAYTQLDFGNTFQWILNRNSIIFIEDNAIENVVCQNGGHLVQGEMRVLSQHGRITSCRAEITTCRDKITFYLATATSYMYLGAAR